MATLKEFEDALREQGMTTALAILDALRSRDRATRRVAPARRVTGQKMTPEVARHILALHASTDMTQQEIAFRVGVNQGRVNEVITRGKWLDGNPNAAEAQARDKAMARMRRPPRERLSVARPATRVGKVAAPGPRAPATAGSQLSLGDL